MGRETFKQAMDASLKATITVEGKISPEAYESTFARMTLKEDLGELGSEWQSVYALDDTTRDRLIAHTRQDAAMNYVAIVELRKQIKTLRVIILALALINLSAIIITLAYPAM